MPDDDDVFGPRQVGLSRVLRQWAGRSPARRVAVLLLQLGPVLLGAVSMPAAVAGSLPARVVVGVVVAFVLAYKVADVRLTRRDDPSRGMR